MNIKSLDPASISNANVLLASQGLRPRKRWGQNFLCDRNVLEKIVRAAALRSEDHVLEIGAGLGALTRSLAESTSKVTAIEIDTLLEPILKETLAEYSNVHLIFEDFLKLDMPDLMNTAFGDRPGVVVANIPYYISTTILERLFEQKDRVSRIVILVQQEFAERICARHDTEEYGALSIFAQYHATVEIAFKVPRQVFLPIPEVSSAVVVLNICPSGSIPIHDTELFFKIVRAAFGKRRKTLLNALSSFGDPKFTKEYVESICQKAEIDPVRRGETLSLTEFGRLADSAHF